MFILGLLVGLVIIGKAQRKMETSSAKISSPV
jgi:hypothetical protein